MSTRGSARVALQNLDMARDRWLCHVHPIAGHDAISERAVNRVETQARDEPGNCGIETPQAPDPKRTSPSLAKPSVRQLNSLRAGATSHNQSNATFATGEGDVA